MTLLVTTVYITVGMAIMATTAIRNTAIIHPATSTPLKSKPAAVNSGSSSIDGSSESLLGSTVPIPDKRLYENILLLREKQRAGFLSGKRLDRIA